MFGPMMGGVMPQMRMPQQQPSRLEGLLGNPLLQVGMGLLAAGQDGNINPYAAAMQGMQNAHHFKNQTEDRKRQQEMQKAQEQFAKMLTNSGGSNAQANQVRQVAGMLAQGGDMQGAASLLVRSMVGDNKTTRMRDFDHRQSLTPEQREAYDKQFSRDTKTFANIEEFNLLKNMSEEERKLWFRNKRGPALDDVGKVPHVFDPLTGQLVPLSTVDEVADNESKIAGDRAHAGAVGKAQGEAQVEVPAAQIQAEHVTGLINDLINHPGRESLTGLDGMFPTIPGTQKADAKALAEQIQGQAFLEARAMLQGQGVISDQESATAQAAFARLQEAQSDESYKKALEDMKSVIGLGLQRLKAKAGITEPTPQVGSQTEEGFVPIEDLVKKYAQPR